MIDEANTEKIVTVSESSDSRKRARSPPPASSDEVKRKVLRKLSEVDESSMDKDKVTSDSSDAPPVVVQKKLKEINIGDPLGKVLPLKMVQISEDALTIVTVHTSNVISELKTQVLRLQNKELQQDEELRFLRKQNMEYQAKIDFLMNFVTKLRKLPASDVSISTTSAAGVSSEGVSTEIPVKSFDKKEVEVVVKEK
jgi:hypothetical protein